jgi:hypothetical protein
MFERATQANTAGNTVQRAERGGQAGNTGGGMGRIGVNEMLELCRAVSGDGDTMGKSMRVSGLGMTVDRIRRRASRSRNEVRSTSPSPVSIGLHLDAAYRTPPIAPFHPRHPHQLATVDRELHRRPLSILPIIRQKCVSGCSTLALTARTVQRTRCPPTPVPTSPMDPPKHNRDRNRKFFCSNAASGLKGKARKGIRSCSSRRLTTGTTGSHLHFSPFNGDAACRCHHAFLLA